MRKIKVDKIIEKKKKMSIKYNKENIQNKSESANFEHSDINYLENVDLLEALPLEVENNMENL